MSEPVVTILFATYNGAKTLPAMLEALCRQTLWRSYWKLVAVDNNSTDATRSILESYKDRLPLTVELEPRQGKEHALATGFRHLAGDLLILTDDDVIPAPDWIEQFVAVAAAEPDYGMFSGLIEPQWEREPEPWLLRDARLDVLYALNGKVDEGPIPAGLVFGPSSAFRRAVVGSTYHPHENLGPNAGVTQYAMGQDTAFALRLERQGVRAFHSRRPRLRHVVKANYVTEDWVLRRAERYGMGFAALHPELFVDRRIVAGAPAGPTLKWLMIEPVARLARRLPRSRLRFQLLWEQGVRTGILRQLRSEPGRRALDAARAQLRTATSPAQ